MKHHYNRNHIQQGAGRHEPEQVEEPCDLQALGGTIKINTIPGGGSYDPMNFLQSNYERIKSMLKHTISVRGSIK